MPALMRAATRVIRAVALKVFMVGDGSGKMGN